jgi:hypothetical protein
MDWIAWNSTTANNTFFEPGEYLAFFKIQLFYRDAICMYS